MPPKADSMQNTRALIGLATLAAISIPAHAASVVAESPTRDPIFHHIGRRWRGRSTRATNWTKGGVAERKRARRKMASRSKQINRRTGR